MLPVVFGSKSAAGFCANLQATVKRERERAPEGLFNQSVLPPSDRVDVFLSSPKLLYHLLTEGNWTTQRFNF